jgi:type 1 glutamine amidotransferase
MKKALKIIFFSLFGLLALAAAALALFVYKVKNGFPVSYETEPPAINFPAGQPAVLLFSKTTGFRHSEAIEAAKPMFAQMAQRNGWFLYETEEGGAFNAGQLAKFKVVIFNNSTGEVINADQKKALESFVENGGGLIGIHGAGDDSHHWEWYQQHLVGAKFSHHPIKNQLQKAELALQPQADSVLWHQLPAKWSHTDEWYIFFNNPLQGGFTGVYLIDGEAIDPDGNLPLLVKGKNFGMGRQHPVAWYKSTGKGRTFYTSMGHTGQAFAQPEMVRLLENAIRWQMQ